MRYPEEDKEKRITQLRKGILELAVMAALYRERHYGYSLVRVLTADGDFSLKEGTIYPILARLHRDGLIQSEWVESVQGPPRKYYVLTRLGRQLFDELQQEFDVLVSLVKRDYRRGQGKASHEPGERILVRKEKVDA